MHPTIAALVEAVNRHDPQGMAAQFAPDYRSEQPVHPGRGFGGREQVAVNWGRMFEAVPDMRAEVVADISDGRSCWSEWSWTGNYPDGRRFALRGVMVMGLREDGLIQEARLYVEPVEEQDEDIDTAVGRIVRPAD